MRPLYLTLFNTTSKKCVGLSMLMQATDDDGAIKMLGKQPDLRTKNTMIFNQPNGQALCVSWIRFSL